jgi:PKD repeat protein
MEDFHMLNNRSHSVRPLIAAIVGAGALIAVPAANATSNGLADWRDAYPNSNSDDAGCTLCHGSSTGQLNAYGKTICDAFLQTGTIPSEWQNTLQGVEDVDSDLDGSVNGLEIDNDTQPGWTSGANPLYTSDFDTGCQLVAEDSTVPNNVPLPYDIAVSGDPVANPNGPYEAVVGETITFDGTGSYDDGEIVQYDWVFGDGTSAPDAGPNPEHAYGEEGVYAVVLTVTDNDRNTNAASTTATISPLNLLDLDIAALSVSKSVRVGRSIPVKLKVENNGAVLGQAIATIVGVQNGDEVYRLRLNVYDDIGRGTTTFDFGSYTPTVAGDILWTATIADEDPDEDMAEAVTSVR